MFFFLSFSVCLTLEIQPDQKPQEISYIVVVNGEQKLEGIGAVNTTEIFGQLDCLYVETTDCIMVAMIDEGDGLCCEHGNFFLMGGGDFFWYAILTGEYSNSIYSYKFDSATYIVRH